MEFSNLINLPTTAIGNRAFIRGVFEVVPAGNHPAVCTKAGDPTSGGWHALPFDPTVEQVPAGNNNYVNCSSFHPDEDGAFSVRKTQFAACHFIMLDDLGGKIPEERLGTFKPSWKIETSPGNYQAGIILAEPITQGEQAESLLNAIIEAGLCDPGSSGPLSRWARLPIGINGKPKHGDKDGKSFRCRLVEWHPENRYTPDQIIAGLGLQIKPASTPTKIGDTISPAVGVPALYDVLQGKPIENPVLVALNAKGLYKSALPDRKHDITCPWVSEHTDALNTGAAYFEPNETYPIGGFCCMHSHRDRYHIRELLDFLDVPEHVAHCKPIVRLIAGEMHRVVDAMELVLKDMGNHYQAGGLIVSVVVDPITNDPSMVPVNSSALSKELSQAAIWHKYDGRSKDWVRSDPPNRYVMTLYDAQSYRYLPPLAGVVRQPYFRDSDGELVTNPGYDPKSKYLAVFDANRFVIPHPSPENARNALTALEALLGEFRFVAMTDKAAALSAIFTAVTRATLPHAPAFHSHAPVIGSGKTYLSELISAFAGPAHDMKVSYPASSEEATKSILSLLLTSPAVINFDDMDTDWTPHGTIKRMLTSDHITDRVLGVSKTATVSTRTLFLGSGNNVGPVRDLLRRVLTIHLDPRTSTPATLRYQGSPVELVRQNRGHYVSAVLTIILAWRQAGSPKATVDNIATYGGAWSDYCRFPLIWMGCPDPATALIQQISHDPDSDALKGLLKAWWNAFESRPTTVRKAVERAKKLDDPASHGAELLDAIREFPVEERGEVNRSKLGWVLKKNANRIVDGMEFQRVEADGRTAWSVVMLESASPALPPSPALSSPGRETGVDGVSDDDAHFDEPVHF